jgi:hypothetical protein
MALTVIGGLITAAIGSLFVIPALYVLIERLRPRARRAARAASASGASSVTTAPSAPSE